MQNKSVSSPSVQIESPDHNTPTLTGNGARLPLSVEVEAEDLVILAIESSKHGVSIDEFVGTLIQVGFDKWRATEPAIA